MRKRKYKKICVWILVFSMLLQIFPMPVQAEKLTNEKSESNASQTEQNQEENANPSVSEKEQQQQQQEDDSKTKDTEEKTEETNKDKTKQNNVNQNDTNQADLEEEKSEEEETKQTETKETETTQEEESKETVSPQESQKTIGLGKTEDFIDWSNKSASEYQYADITITRADDNPFDLTKEINGKTFQGFGSKEYPFKGTISITNPESRIDIPLNHAFFNYLDQSATINKGLYLKAKGVVNTPLLAENFVCDESSKSKAGNISLMINGDKDQEEKASFGGIIGTMAENTSLILSVKDLAEEIPEINGSGDLGFFCNTMEAGAKLTISAYNDETNKKEQELSYPVSSTGGNAGGLVGKMKTGTVLTVEQAYSLKGDVKTTAKKSAAGGLVGESEDATITLNQKVVRSGNVEGTEESSGYIGNATYKDSNNSIDLNNFSIQNLVVKNGNHSGGFFGVLNYDCKDGGTITVQNAEIKNLKKSKDDFGIKHEGTSWQFGGIIGQYSANSNKSTLCLKNPEIEIDDAGAVTALGGTIGLIAGDKVDDRVEGTTQAYVEIEDASTDISLGEKSNVSEALGGLVAEMGNPGKTGHLLSVSGKTTVKEDDNGKTVGLGGILGKSENGVLRISGTTDLSGMKIGKTGTSCGQIAGSIDGTIVYALGSGNESEDNKNETEKSAYNWKLIRPSKQVSVSDIGSYGEVIRLDGSTLKETEQQDSNSETDETTLLSYDKINHQVSVINSWKTADNLTVGSKRDLAALAILMQRDSSLLRKNITIDGNITNKTIDLSGTGIYSILRDDGTQIYTGTFDGKNCTVKVSAGEAYGYLKEEKSETLVENKDGNSTTVGIGQLYNHSTIGFIPYCNGTVQNLTLDGSIYFQNVSGGVEVRCGAVAGYTTGAAFLDITVKTETVYRDGQGGDDLKVISIGGLVGRATGNATFTSCSMQGSISSASGCHDFAIGGYLASADASGDKDTDTGANVTFKNCTISNAKIKHTKFADNSSAPDARFGGVIGYVNGSVTIQGLTIDTLSMESYATSTAGGLLGYYWRKKNNTDSMTITGLAIKNSSLNVNGTFGGLVYGTDAYWKIGDGTGTEGEQKAPNGIRFETESDKANTFQGKTSETDPSALLFCSTTRETDTNKARYDKAYIEIRKNGLEIQKDAVNVTLTGGDYFDDIAGKTKYGEDGYNAVLSIGLTEWKAENPTLINQDSQCNTWANQCKVNKKTDYTNKNTRYYYNVDYYRKQVEGTEVTDIDTAGKLLLRSLYVYGRENLKQYFVKGSDDFKLKDNIDLTGVSYYPMSRVITIEDATVTFDYQNMNQQIKVNDKGFSEIASQHYQMQTGLFSKVTQKFTVNNLRLKGTFGRYEIYEKTGENKTGALICDSIAQEDDKLGQAGITITGLTLDGIRCEDGKACPLLINRVGSNTVISMNDVTYTRDAYENSKQPVASALMGKVGSDTATKISLEFTDMDLNRKDENSFFQTAIFAESFQYADGASGGSYNFEKPTGTETAKITFGKEISNGVTNVKIEHNRNSYNTNDTKNVTGQVWYLDTFGNTEAGSYVGADGAKDAPQDFSKYLPYIREPENAEKHYYEIDVNQKAVYLVDGCGTYGHPWLIKEVSATDGQKLFTGEDQMMTVMKLLDDVGRNGVALKINKSVLNTKLKGQGEVSVHTADTADDVVLVKNGGTWVEAELVGKRYRQKTGNDAYAYMLSNESMMAYLRNGYFCIEEDLTLNIGQFNGFGSDSISKAFSGVIVGKHENGVIPTITLTGENKTGEVGGLIRYSQGSVVKDLNIKFDNVTFTGKSARHFFGGVIGWAIGGDSIIDNVTIDAESVVNKKRFKDSNEDSLKLTAVGGYVGIVGGSGNDTNDKKDWQKGGGVVFRNISSKGLTEISKKKTDTEVSDRNTYYYWNPYVGRVLDGYACAEADNCDGMGTNTDKNYAIPKLNKNDKLKIECNTSSTNIKNITIYSKSTIKITSEQSIWLLSAIVNSGFGSKVYSGNYANSDRIDASYYGRTRIGTYNGIGTDKRSEEDTIDETDYWGGRIKKNEKDEYDSVDHRNHSTSYLSTYVDAVKSSEDNTIVESKAATYSLTVDNDGRNIVFEKKTYDLGDYGNGFRGIGYNYGAIEGSKYGLFDELKSKALRLMNNDVSNKPAVNGNEATIKYCRNIYEYDKNDINVSQAGFFTQCLANSSAEYTVKNLNFKDVILKRNFFKDYVALGVVVARDGAYSPSQVVFEKVKVENAELTQADQSAALFGYMSNGKNNNNESISFKDCQVKGFQAGIDGTDRMNHCGAFIGNYDTSSTGKSRTIKFERCSAEDIRLYNVQNGGLLGGYISGTCTVTGGNVKNGNITSRTQGSSGYSMGGLIGKTGGKLTVRKAESTSSADESGKITISNIKINGTKDISSSSDPTSYAGGLAGYAQSADIQDVTVDSVTIAGKNLGGVIGGAGATSMRNVEVKDSVLANCKDKNGKGKLDTGGVIGTVLGTFNGFNLLSKNNVVGYLIDKGAIKLGCDSGELNNLSKDKDNVGLKLNQDSYTSYKELKADAKLDENTPCGIWVGNANDNDVKLISVSRQGDYSAVNNIGTNEGTDSYVIYADYTGQAQDDSSTISSKPDAEITVRETNLTGDGATMPNETPVRDTIITATDTNTSLMKGYYGGEQGRPLDSIMLQFAKDDMYKSRLSTYQKEDATYNGTYNGKNFPILILNATTKNELNRIVNDYISILTNAVQTQKAHYYKSINPTTYQYGDDNQWSSTNDPTMSWTEADGIKINSGKYDNNKKQITILDVVYSLKENEDTYHLYIPVFVKKLMEVECSVKIVNGAVGYDPEKKETQAPLNSFGENYTSHISYTYKWMVSEWQSLLENGDSLLWNFDKTVALGNFQTLNRDKIHLTLINMNTHKNQDSYYQSTLEDLKNKEALSKDNDSDRLKLDKMAEMGYASYICDLLPLKSTEDSTDGTLKIVDKDDKSAILRIWEGKAFAYYAPKTNNDSKDTKYYKVELNLDSDDSGNKLNPNDILPVTEEYYLVMNSTQGDKKTQMINAKVELNKTYTNQQIPTKITGTTEQVYVLGDFYKINDFELESNSANKTQEMKSGSNDTINVKISSQVAAAADEKAFGAYVNKRDVYYQYAIQLVDQDGNSVPMKGAASISSLKMKKADGTEISLAQSDDLSKDNCFTMQFGENGCIITIKSLGENYTGATITADMDFSYTSAELNEQFPHRSSNQQNTGVAFKANVVMAYQQESLGSSCITAGGEAEKKLYYRTEEAQAKLNYDSYNITSKDGNTSQLGINGRENNDQAMEITTRALFDASTVSGLNLTNETNENYPYYLEGELSLEKKTDSGEDNKEAEYKEVAIGKYLSDFKIQSDSKNTDITSNGLGLQADGKTFKFRIRLTQSQVSDLMTTPLLVNINYKVKTGKELEKIEDSQYANYKVTLSVMLKNKESKDLLTTKATDYLIYTNAKVYLGIVGVTD